MNLLAGSCKKLHKTATFVHGENKGTERGMTFADNSYAVDNYKRKHLRTLLLSSICHFPYDSHLWHTWYNKAEQMPPASGQLPLTTIGERVNKIPAGSRNIREESRSQLWTHVIGADLRIQWSLAFESHSCSLRRRRDWQRGIPMTEMIRRTATCVSNICPSTQHLQDVLHSGARLGCWDRFPACDYYTVAWDPISIAILLVGTSRNWS